MARFAFKFIDEIDDSFTSEVYVTEFANNKYIDIVIYEHKERACSFTMSKSTAIKFAKTLRTEINKITESEDSNV